MGISISFVSTNPDCGHKVSVSWNGGNYCGTNTLTVSGGYYNSAVSPSGSITVNLTPTTQTITATLSYPACYDGFGNLISSAGSYSASYTQNLSSTPAPTISSVEITNSTTEISGVHYLDVDPTITITAAAGSCGTLDTQALVKIDDSSAPSASDFTSPPAGCVLVPIAGGTISPPSSYSAQNKWRYKETTLTVFVKTTLDSISSGTDVKFVFDDYPPISGAWFTGVIKSPRTYKAYADTTSITIPVAGSDGVRLKLNLKEISDIAPSPTLSTTAGSWKYDVDATVYNELLGHLLDTELEAAINAIGGHVSHTTPPGEVVCSGSFQVFYKPNATPLQPGEQYAANSHNIEIREADLYGAPVISDFTSSLGGTDPTIAKTGSVDRFVSATGGAPDFKASEVKEIILKFDGTPTTYTPSGSHPQTVIENQTHTYNFEAEDNAGNIGISGNFVFMVDSIPPTGALDFASSQITYEVPAGSGDIYVQNKDVDFTITHDDAGGSGFFQSATEYGAIRMTHGPQGSSTPPTAPTLTADYSTSGIPVDSASSTTTTLTLVENTWNYIHAYVMDDVGHISHVGTLTCFVDTDPPTATVTNPTFSAPYTAVWLSGTADEGTTSAPNGSILLEDIPGSQIMYEHLEYSSSTSVSPTYSTTPSPNFSTPPYASYTIDLNDIHETDSNLLAQPSGGDYYLHCIVKDVAQNESTPVRVDFKIDNDYPIYTNNTWNAGVVNISGDSFVLTGRIYDQHSGVIYVEKIEGSSTISHNSSYYLSTNHTASNPYIYYENFPISTSPSGTARKIYIHSKDQANNIIYEESQEFYHNGCGLTWHSITGNRDPALTPFIVKGNFDAEVTGCSNVKIKGFFATADLAYTPQNSDFDTTNGEHTRYQGTITEYSFTVPNTNTEYGIVHLLLTDGHITSRLIHFTSLSYGGLTYNPPTMTINELTNELYTNSALNIYTVTISAGEIIGYGYDEIIGYKITEISSPLTSELPTYDSGSGIYIGANPDWTIFPLTSSAVTEQKSFSFSTYGSKNVYVQVVTMASVNGLLPDSVYVSSPYSIEYVDDFIGPKVTNILIDGSAPAVSVSGTAPNEVFDSSPYTTAIQLVSISGTLTDLGNTPTLIRKWCITNDLLPPQDTSIAWNYISPSPLLTYNFTANTVLPPLNSVKSVYIHAVDVVGNMSTNQIKIELDSPSFILPPLGTTFGFRYKFEGTPIEHQTRSTIVSMFGNGLKHNGFIPKYLNDYASAHGIVYQGVTSNRVHNLRDYRGLRVIEQGTRIPMNLPEDPLKFSDFVKKLPRISDLEIVGSLSSTMSTLSEPSREGEVRYLALHMDIDTGYDGKNPSYSWLQSNLIDPYTEWAISFVSEDGLTSATYLQGVDFTVIDGIVQNFSFSSVGTYVVVALSSFGFSVARAFTIYAATDFIPKIQDPPIDVNVNIGSTGTTTISLEYDITQLARAVDAIFVLDKSNDYVPIFSQNLAAVISDFCNQIDQFAYDTSTSTKHSRYGLITFGSTTAASSGITNELLSGFTTNPSDIGAALNSLSAVGPYEAKVEAIGKAAEEYFPYLQWKNNAIHMIILFSNEEDLQPYGGGTYASSAEYRNSTGTNYFMTSLINNNIMFVYFDDNISSGVSLQDEMTIAVNNTAQNGSIIQTLSKFASQNTIRNAMSAVYNNYTSIIKYRILPELKAPSIIQSAYANTVHGLGTTASQIPYSNLIPVGTIPQKAKFDVVLDDVEVNNCGVTDIHTYITIYDSSNNPIKRKMLRIHLVEP